MSSALRSNSPSAPSTVRALLLLAMLVVPATALAQAPAPATPVPAAPAEEPLGITLGLDAWLGLPVSDYGDTVDLAVGGLLRFEYALFPCLSLTARGGFVYDLESDGDFFSYSAPIYAGVRGAITPSGLFLFGETGATYTHYSLEYAGVEYSKSDLHAGLGFGFGFPIGFGDVSFGGWIPDLDDSSSYVLMLSLGADLLQR